VKTRGGFNYVISRSNGFGDEALSGLSEALKSLACLQEVNLKVLGEEPFKFFANNSLCRCPKITNIGLKGLSQCLKEMASLENITLDFGQSIIRRE